MCAHCLLFATQGEVWPSVTPFLAWFWKREEGAARKISCWEKMDIRKRDKQHYRWENDFTSTKSHIYKQWRTSQGANCRNGCWRGEKCISTLTTEEFIGRDAVEAIILIEDTIARLAREKQWKSEDIASAYTSSQEECIAGEERHGERATGRLQSSAAFCRKCENRLPRDAAYCPYCGTISKIEEYKM